MRAKAEEILNDILLTSDEKNLDVNLIYSKLEELKKLPKFDENEEIMGDRGLTELINGYISGDNAAKLNLANYIVSNIKVQEKASYSSMASYSDIPASDYKIEAQELGRSLAKDEVIQKFRLSFDDNTWNRVSSFSNFEVRYVLGYLNNVMIPLNAVWIFSDQSQGIWIFAKLNGLSTLTLNIRNQIVNVRSLWEVITDTMLSEGTDMDTHDLEDILQRYGMTYTSTSHCENLLPPPKFIKSIEEIAMDLFKENLKHPIVSALGPELVIAEDRSVTDDSGKIIAFGSKHCLLVKIFKNYDNVRDQLIEEWKQSSEGNFPDERSTSDYMIVRGNYEVPPFELSSYSEEKSAFCNKLIFVSEAGISVGVDLRGDSVTEIKFTDLNDNSERKLTYKSEMLSDEDVYNVCKLLVGCSKPSETLDEIAVKCMAELSKHGTF